MGEQTWVEGTRPSCSEVSEPESPRPSCEGGQGESAHARLHTEGQPGWVEASGSGTPLGGVLGRRGKGKLGEQYVHGMTLCVLSIHLCLLESYQLPHKVSIITVDLRLEM